MHVTHRQTDGLSPEQPTNIKFDYTHDILSIPTQPESSFGQADDYGELWGPGPAGHGIFEGSESGGPGPAGHWGAK